MQGLYFCVLLFSAFGKLFLGPSKWLNTVAWIFFLVTLCFNAMRHILLYLTALYLVISNFQFLVCTTHANEN